MDQESNKQRLQVIGGVGMRLGSNGKKSPDIQEHLESYSLSTPLLPRDCLYGGRCETFTLHAVECDESVIKYVDVQSLYPYVCKNKHYPVGHPRCLMGPNLTGMNFTEFEGPVKCKVLPPQRTDDSTVTVAHQR